ncbi:MAG: hypothetical protein WBW04_19300 [Nitrolancea sp.]
MSFDNDFRVPAYVSLEDAASIFARDLPSLSEAQLVQVLFEARDLSYYLIAGMLAPLARAELARRRAASSTSPVSRPEDFQRSRSS